LKLVFKCFAALSLCVITSGAWAATQYSYTGSPYTIFNPNDGSNVFFPAGSVSGTFSVGAPLAANLSGQDISGDVVSYSFSSGAATLTDANSAVAAFDVTTDGAGSITGWLIFITTPVAAPGDLADLIAIRSASSNIVYKDGECASVSATACTSFISGTGSNASTSGGGPGAWAQVSPRSVPALSPAWLTGLALLLALFGAYRLRYRTSD
jgi:hypothetical protein